MTREPIYLTWLNAKGGFEYFFFNTKNAYQVEVLESGVSRNNILPNWQKSYGKTADTIEKNTYRRTKKSIVLKSPHLNRNQLEALSYIKSSVLVQIVYSRNDRRTVLVDTNSFVKYDEQTKGPYAVQFTISHTDEIPAQRV